MRSKRFSLLLTIILLACFSDISAQTTENSLSLAGTWKLTWADGTHGPRSIFDLATQNPQYDPQRYVDAQVPGEIHDVFRKMGIIGDPNIGLNALHSEWVALQYYQYFKEFVLPGEALEKEIWLVFDQLDLVADIYINGRLAGKHKNAHHPCRLNVTDKLQEGKNILTVALESGLYDVSEKAAIKYGNVNGFIQSIDKRHYQRKPQYQFNWDWNPRYINVGITGDVRLEWAEIARLDQVTISQDVRKDLQNADIKVQSFVEGVATEKQLEITVTVMEKDLSVSKSFSLQPGLHPYAVDFAVNNPQLWWPAQQGEQFRYTFKTDLRVDGEIIASKVQKVGLRRVEVDQSPHPEKGYYFTIKINNRPLFMKGACWVPPDMVYSKVKRSRLDSLVNFALEANFNMIRVWGGGEYAGHDLLDLCDEKGLLVSHDFMFACSIYPGDDKAFYELVRKEVTWISREYSYHPSLVVWMGNNEIETIFWDGDGRARPVMTDYVLYHHLMPAIVKSELGESVFYWPSSPSSKNPQDHPGDPYSGDQHPWGVTLQKDDANFYAYRNYVDRFADEGGVLGASAPATIKQMLPEDQQYVRSFTWDFHDNLVNYWRKNELGISYRTFDFHLGKLYTEVPFDDFLFGSSLLQSEGLQEYIYNYRRRKFSSSAAIFWMYNDSWPVSNGWTIVDYYLRKKLAFHPVRRAFDEIVVVVTKEDDRINVYGVNDNPDKWSGNLRYGVFTNEGPPHLDKTKKVAIPANTSVVLATFDYEKLKKEGIEKSGAFALLQQDGQTVSQNRLLLGRFKDFPFTTPDIKIRMEDGKAVFSSDSFVWGVAIDIDGESNVSDNCFDLIPGIPYSVNWSDKTKQPVVLRTGNDLIAK